MVQVTELPVPTLVRMTWWRCSEGGIMTRIYEIYERTLI